METFSFFIPLAVISAMGLVHDGETVSKWVRISDLLADGKMTVSDYLELASAGMVVVKLPLFTFQAVEETAEGWSCLHFEPEPQAWEHTREFLWEMFLETSSETRETSVVTPLPQGGFYNLMLCSYEWVERMPIDWDQMTIRLIEGPVEVDVTNTENYRGVEYAVTVVAITESSEPLEYLIDYNG